MMKNRIEIINIKGYFMCPQENCDTKFKTLDAIKRHFINHPKPNQGPEKKYEIVYEKCDFCGWTFTNYFLKTSNSKG